MIMSSFTRGRGQGGFTLIEVLVALVIMLVGMMGAAGLMVRTVKQEVEAYQRLEALNLLQDMVDRLNANREVHTCYSDGALGINVGINSAGEGITENQITDCAAGTAGQNSRADTDLEQWNEALQGVAVQQGEKNVGAMIGARGCIVQVDAGEQIYRITVAWQGLAETVAPASDNGCGKDLYGEADDENREKLRRTVSALVRVGDLS